VKEGDYQKYLKDRIKKLLPGSIVLKNDPTWIQGIPDLTILHGDRWASLEVKKSGKEPHQPNQDYYVEKMGGMAFSSFIFPENEEEVLDGLQRALEPGGAPRVS
jgi:hypothetical protein